MVCQQCKNPLTTNWFGQLSNHAKVWHIECPNCGWRTSVTEDYLDNYFIGRQVSLWLFRTKPQKIYPSFGSPHIPSATAAQILMQQQINAAFNLKMRQYQQQVYDTIGEDLSNLMVNITYDLDLGAYKLTCPYNKAVVETIKAAIPVGKREYDPITKTWTFMEEFLPVIEKALKLLNIVPTIRTRAEAEAAGAKRKVSMSPVTKLTPLEVALLRFAQALPQDSLKKAYRDAAMQLHPDRQSGDSSKMTELNAAWDEVNKAKGA